MPVESSKMCKEAIVLVSHIMIEKFKSLCSLKPVLALLEKPQKLSL